MDNLAIEKALARAAECDRPAARRAFEHGYMTIRVAAVRGPHRLRAPALSRARALVLQGALPVSLFKTFCLLLLLFTLSAAVSCLRSACLGDDDPIPFPARPLS